MAAGLDLTIRRAAEPMLARSTVRVTEGPTTVLSCERISGRIVHTIASERRDDLPSADQQDVRQDMVAPSLEALRAEHQP